MYSTLRKILIAAAAVMLMALAGCGDDDGVKADAGSDFSVGVGGSPTYDGCGSTGAITNYEWVIRDTPSKMDEDVDKPIRELDENCSFTLDAAMVIDELGDWTVELTVSDADGNASSDSVVITVTE